MKRLPLIVSFVLFIVLCISATYWAMQVFKPQARAIAAPPLAALSVPHLDAAAALFGVRPVTTVASKFQLKGVVVASDPAESVAILSSAGKPTRAVKTNAEVLPGVIVKEIHRHYVLLSEGGTEKRIELTPLVRPR